MPHPGVIHPWTMFAKAGGLALPMASKSIRIAATPSISEVVDVAVQAMQIIHIKV